MYCKPITLTLLLILCPVMAGAQLGPGHSGSWYWAEQDGHGFSIEIGQTLSGEPLGVVYWYTYNDVGHPIFLLGIGTPVGDTLDVEFLSPWGMAFGVFDPGTMHYPGGGLGRFVFTDENSATFQYEPSQFTADTWGHAPITFMPLTKLFGIPVTESQQVEALEARVAQLETLLQDMSRLIDPNTGHETVRFEGVNVQIVNGTGTTDGNRTGTGNLIIGYNERRDQGQDDPRTGSHMLVIGSENSYGIGSFGGMVVGRFNQTSAAHASVSGGVGNHASGEYSSVSGGANNTASGRNSSVSGGIDNTASGRSSSVSGGVGNSASGLRSSVSGGSGNAASGSSSSVSGGSGNNASAYYTSVSGGSEKTAATIGCTVGDDGVDC